MKTLSLTKYSLFIFLFIAGFFVVLPIQATASSPKPNINSFVPNEDEKFNRIFREGRDLIDKEDWAKAAEKFKEIVCDCPEKKSVDRAFYWLAFCYKKQKMYKEADQTIDRLLKNFPNSSWADDARVMKYQVAEVALSPTTATAVRGQVSRPTEVRSVPLTTNLFLGSSQDPQTPLDRQDEIRLAAFQSLFAADQKKAIETLGEILKTNSSFSETLKREVLRSLRTPLSFRSNLYETYNGTFQAKSVGFNSFNPQNLDLLKETLFRGFQTESNINVKSGIIYTIASLNDESSANYLIKIYDSEENKVLKKSLIGSFSQNSVFWTVPSYASAPAKVQNQNPTAVAEQNIPSTSNKNFSIRNIYLIKLADIVRDEKDNELRLLAFSKLQGFPNWEKQSDILDILIKIYDEESNDNFKSSIISSLGRLKQKQAVDKLFNIAKNDNSNTLRLQAIYALRNNQSPEAIKFLEELIK